VARYRAKRVEVKVPMPAANMGPAMLVRVDRVLLLLLVSLLLFRGLLFFGNVE